ncbi:MAG: flagellar hook-basal body complex protein FliE [Planctomycetota bacterium]
MVDKVNPYSGQPLFSSINPGISQAAQAGHDVSFKDLISRAIEEVNKLQIDADNAMKEFAKTGSPEKLPEVITKIKQAEIAFDLLVQIRNKVIDAYNDIQRMPL